MTNNTYTVDLLATGIPTVIETDDGIGSDWLVFSGVYVKETDIRLSYTSAGGISTSAMGFYYNPGNNGHRLVVNGLIENVRGANSTDYIQGNEVGNILYGDAASTGPGGNDSIYGLAGNDTIFGGAGNDSVGGDQGNDLLYGNNGNDHISGGDGNDTVIGGAGADVISGGAQARDLLSYAGSNAAVNVKITYGSATTGSGGHAQGDVINGFADLLGSGYNDVLTDTVSGTIAFGYNANTFSGGAGNDLLKLGGGNDTGLGGIGSDSIYGGIGNDVLNGDSGADWLTGGAGLDRLRGGGGADHFVFTKASDSTASTAGRDLIYDFSRAEADHINLTAIDANPSLALNQSFVWRGASGFNGAHGAVRAINSGANTLVQADLNGDKVADFSITVIGVHDMIASDFLL